jgi:hypothetical protein
VVEGARLESVFRGNSNVGSNPTLSAIHFGLIIRYSLNFCGSGGQLGEESYSFKSSRAFRRWQEKALDLGIQLRINRANLIEGALLLPEEA